MEIEVVSELIEQYGAEVMIFCRRLTGCVPDAQDLYQQTFLKLMEMRVRIEREKNPRAFIFAVANSIWKNERRKLMRRALIAPSFSLEDEQTQDALELPDTEDTQQQVIERICRQQLSLAVQRLEPKFRTPILLMYGFGMSIEQIAQIERVPKGTIKSRLNRAKKKLRKEMEAYGDGE